MHERLFRQKLAPKTAVSRAPEKELVITPPYLGKLSLQIGTRISRIMKNKLLNCNIQFVFQTKCNFKVTLMEGLLINRDHPALNKKKQSLPFF